MILLVILQKGIERITLIDWYVFLHRYKYALKYRKGRFALHGRSIPHVYLNVE